MTTLVEEKPFVAVVTDKFRESTCAKCFAWNCRGVKEDVKLFKCSRCLSIFYCSKKCQIADWEDHEEECEGITSTGVIPSQNVRFIARFIKKWWTMPESKAFNGRHFFDLAPPPIETTKPDVIDTSRRAFVELQKFQRFFRELGIKENHFFMYYMKAYRNSFGILDSSPDSFTRGIGMYMGVSVHKHSCRPDAFVVFKGAKLVLRTTKENCIYSEELTICYPGLSLFRNTSMRRSYLLRRNGFDCECEECQDEEADKKRISGRPECCPEGYFLLSDLRCSACNKKVSEERKIEVEKFNFILHTNAIEAEKDTPERMLFTIEILENFFVDTKEYLSDHNTYFIGVADMLFSRTMQNNPYLARKYGDYVIRQTSDRPHSVHSALLKARFFCVLDNDKRPLKDRKEALAQALEAVEVVYGEDHEFTNNLKNKKLEIELEELKLH